jgi:hypothetical protein
MEYGEVEVSVEGEDVGVDQEFVGEPSHAVEEELEAEVAVALAAAEDEDDAAEGEGVGKGVGKGEGEDEPVFDMSRSDILIIPHNTSEEDEPDSSKRPCVDKRVPFTKSNFEKPTLQLGNTFESVYDFRKAIKQANILKGNDLVYQKNSRSKVIAVCGDKNCKYRVYGRQLKGDATFMLISLRPKHTCARKYKNHLITSKWIAEWCLDSFRDQPNMLVEVLKKKVKKK